MRVFVAGASGAVGRPLVRQLHRSGHQVVALTRSERAATELNEVGVETAVADVLNPPQLLEAVRELKADAVIAQLTSLKKPPATHRLMSATDRLREEGTANLVAVAEQAGAHRFVTQSMMFGYGWGVSPERALTEDDTFGRPARGRWEEHIGAMRINEEKVRSSNKFEGIALRYGLFYGIGTGDDELVEGLRKRRLPVVRGGAPLSWVYIEDAASAAVAALEHGEPGSAYNIADDEPVSWEGMLTAAAHAVGAPTPRAVPAGLLRLVAPVGAAMMRGGTFISSERAKSALGWAPAVPSYREGVKCIAAAHTR